jgi:transcriptional regulator with XRE-family HTH domain
MIYKKMPKLSDRLKYIRQRHNLSQAELAQKAGTTQQAIQQAEKGKARQPRYLHKMAHALDIPVDWLIFGEQEAAQKSSKKTKGLNDKSAEVLESFFSMPEKDQKLIYELMQSRRDKK